MKRHENQSARPTAGSLSVPLFNQTKRNRVPLTSAPSESEFFSHSEYMASTSTAAPHNTSGIYGCYQASGPPSAAPQGPQWNRQAIPQSTQPQQNGSNRPAPTMRAFAPIPHPYKVVNTSSRMGQPKSLMSTQDSTSLQSVNSRQGNYQALGSNERVQSKQTPQSGFSQMGQQPFFKMANPTHQYFQQSRRQLPPIPTPSRPSMQPQNHWKFTNSFGPQNSCSEETRSSNKRQTVRQTPTQETSPVRPAIDNSLRILTSVIDGMRHWGQFKDKVPYLFELFATLDSAVTQGCHGSKNFLLRDGKMVVQCVFYENEQKLPRLIRGQVHRCIGNYDRTRDVLICVSVRPGQPSELRNAQEVVKACDAEMRRLVKSFTEV